MHYINTCATTELTENVNINHKQSFSLAQTVEGNEDDSWSYKLTAYHVEAKAFFLNKLSTP